MSEMHIDKNTPANENSKAEKTITNTNKKKKQINKI